MCMYLLYFLIQSIATVPFRSYWLQDDTVPYHRLIHNMDATYVPIFLTTWSADVSQFLLAFHRKTVVGQRHWRTRTMCPLVAAVAVETVLLASHFSLAFCTRINRWRYRIELHDWTESSTGVHVLICPPDQRLLRWVVALDCTKLISWS